MSGNISVRYELLRSDFSLDVDVDIPMRGITGVFGESGAGKTALLRCIAGLERGASGRLVIAGEVWQDEAISRPVHEREIGYVFQEPRLFAHLNARQNIEYGQRRGRREDVGFDEAVELLKQALKKREFYVIALWGFFPAVPTDLICYVSETLHVKLWKCLLGVAVGEGVICAIYIFGGKSLLSTFL